MKFHEKYHQSEVWYERVLIMEIFHLAMIHSDKNWTVSKTAEAFGVSLGLTSENLRLAHALHSDSIREKLMKCETRQDALKRLNGYR